MTTTRTHYGSQLVWGGILLLLGAALLLSNLRILEIDSIWDYWPLIIVALGIGKLIAARNPRERGGAIWLIFIGAWLYVSVFRVFGFGFHDSWPILLIGVGVSIVAKSLYSEKLKEHEEVAHE